MNNGDMNGGPAMMEPGMETADPTELSTHQLEQTIAEVRGGIDRIKQHYNYAHLLTESGVSGAAKDARMQKIWIELGELLDQLERELESRSESSAEQPSLEANR